MNQFKDLFIQATAVAGLAVILTCHPTRSLGTAGDLDPTFGAGGATLTAFGTGAEAFALARQFDGKLIAAGSATVSGSNTFGLARFLPDGEIDPSFGNAGLVTTAFGLDSADGRAIAVQPDGKILVAGSVLVAGNRNFAMARYLADGTLDPDFGTAGKVVTDLGGTNDAAFALVIQPDGGIVVAGSSNVGASTDFALVRYASDGSLDGAFGASGVVLTGFETGSDIAFALVRQPDGRLVAAGTTESGTSSRLGLARYLSDGSLDVSFGNAGRTSTSISQFDAATAVLVQGDGKIVAAGLSQGVTGTAFTLARYTPNGQIDSTFGMAGVVRTIFGPGSSEAFGVAQQADGRLVAIGWVNSSSSGGIALARYMPDGGLDPAFGSGGLVVTSAGGRMVGAFAGPLVASDRLVVAGRGSGEFGIAWFLLTDCGDGVVDAEEVCDDGNAVDGDACSSSCVADPCIDSPPGLLARWPADGTPVDIVADRDGTLRAGAAFLPGQTMQAFSLDGVDDYVEIAADAVWDFASGPFTIDLWTLFSATPSNQGFLARSEMSAGDCDAEGGWALRLAAGQLAFEVSTPGSAPVAVVSAPWAPLPGEWHHVALTRNAGAYALYIDGALAATGTAAAPLPSLTGPLLIGQSGECGQPDFFGGLLDELEVFGRALTPKEIEAIAGAGNGGQCKICGDEVVTAGEACDDGGESVVCDADCTAVVCGDGVFNSAAGEACDDGGESAVCDLDCTAVVCGDDVVNATAGEDCEDGNTQAGDCCSALCRFESSDTPCAGAGGGDVCTVNRCDGAGACVGGPPTNCRKAGKAILVLKKKEGGGDKVIWKWLRGEATSLEDFGNPLATADQALCVYQGDDEMELGRAVINADGVRWKPSGSTGFRYNDPAQAPDGVDKIILKSGLSGRAKVILKGKGPNLPELTAPFELPLKLQLVNGETNICWESTFRVDDVTKNSADQFKGKATGP